jgi:transcriptional regulator with XRE-family HTH domain
MTQTDGYKPASIGEVGKTVVRNVTDLSEARGLSLRKLSERLKRLGRPILPSALHALSQGARRVDVDDLVALAVALGVNPNALLFPRHAEPDSEVGLTPEVRQKAWTVWRWAIGEMPLADDKTGTPAAAWRAQADFVVHSGFGATTTMAGHSVLQELRNLTARAEDLLGDMGNPATYEPREQVLLIALERVSLAIRELTSQARIMAAERRQPELIPQEFGPPLVRGPLNPVTDPFGHRNGS